MIAIAVASLAGCSGSAAPPGDSGIDSGPGHDAGPHAAPCAARCEECAIGPCGADGSGWCASQGECVATAADCDAVRACITGPDPLASIEVCADGVMVWLGLDRIVPIARDTDGYRPPDPAVREHVGAAIAAIERLDAPAAESEAGAAGYVVCRGEGAESELVLLRPGTGGTGHATIAIRALGAPREVVLEAPHPVFDTGTLEETVAIFDRIGARALVASGTHRCASSRASGCDGVADACGIDAPVRESDMAHAIDSVFHAAHVALAGAYPDAWVISVHGFGGPGVSVSDGTNDPTRLDTRVARLTHALDARFADVTTCNIAGDPEVDWYERVCGTNNVQGRHLNGSAMECADPPIAASDRFAHIEQEPAIRAERALDVADAIAEAYDAHQAM